MKIDMTESEFTGPGTADNPRKPPIIDDFPALRNMHWYYDGQRLVIPSMPTAMQTAINNHPKWGSRVSGD